MSAPDPPDSNDGKDGKERSAATPAPAGAGAARGLSEAEAAAAASRMATERQAVAERAASSMYHHLPMPGRLGMGLGGSALGGPGAGNLLHQLQLSDMHQRIALEQRHREREALFAAAARGPAAWASHPGAAAAAAAEERWRVSAGLPPLGANPLLAARGLHPGVHGLGARGLSGAHLASLGVGAEAELRAAEAEYAERVAAMKAAEEPPEAADAPVPGANTSSAIDLLAAAAENTLRTEGREKPGMSAEEPDGKPPADPSTGSALPASNGDAGKASKEKEKPAKKKRGRGKGKGKGKGKGSNEPKNPLGAFVFYQRKIMADVFEENPCITFGEAAAECGRRWRVLPNELKEEFRQLAADDKVRYTRELATFKNKGELNGDSAPPKPAAAAAPKAKPAPKRKKPDVDEKGRPEPKRPKSALLFFKAQEVPKVMKDFPHVTAKEASTEAAARYKALSKPDKQKYEKMASEDKERYQRELKEKAACDINPGAETSPKARNGNEPDNLPIEEDKEMQTPDEAKSKKDDDDNGDAKTEKDINGWSPAAVQVPAQVGYEAMKDPHPYYVEEHAWRYHNPPLPPAKVPAVAEPLKTQQFPYVSHEELRPLPPPPPVPTVFPNTPFCRWSFDEDTRVLYADFRRPSGESGDVVVTLEDEKFLLEMYERDDITVISEGLVSGLDKEKWTLDYMSRLAGDEYYHRFRRFDKQKVADIKPKKKSTKKSKADAPNEPENDKFVAVAHAEIDKMLSMKVKDFIGYLRKRGSALTKLNEGTLSAEEKTALCTYSFPDHIGVEHKIDVTETALYMLDYDMVKLLPTLYDDFQSCFKLKDCLPGGAHCMMNCVNTNGRPFMGPNMYITPPGAFTHFHQDGHGTVDSGHFCLSGFNEVVMTRRLTERAKRHALRILTGSYKQAKGPSYEGLYDLPHGDNLGEKPRWPDNEAIAECNKMNYCVSRFILRAGQCVHINKGRLHAFRKVTNEELPPTDCHAKLRAELMIPGTNEPVVGSGKPEILCISVAWDWMYRGVTARGINREIISILECAALNRKYGALSLAIPELSLIQMARTLAPNPEEGTAPPGAYRETLFGFEDCSADNYDMTPKGFSPSASVICKGIFPGLQYVVKQHIYAINVAESLKSKSFERGKRVSVAERPNAWENPVTHPLDPYGNSDFFCKLCNKELSNVYLHCDGCELLLSKDFNICLECHQEKRYATSVQMHPLNNKRHSTINHIGNFTFDRASRCPCKNGPVCRHCNFCAGCSCRCHSWFTLYFRFFKKCDELKLLHRVKRLVGREELDAAEEAEKRLSMAIKGRYSEDGEGGPFGLHNMDVMVESQFADAEDAGDLEVEAEQGPTSPAESDSEGSKDAAQMQPKRKSRRVLPKPAESTPKVSGDEDEVMADAEDDPTSHIDSPTSHIDRTNTNDLQVGVSDMTVTIRYRSCEWTKEERDILYQSLEEGMDWEAIASELPERGIDQIRKYATTAYPVLVNALKKRDSNGKMEVEPEEVKGSEAAVAAEEANTEKEVVKTDIGEDKAAAIEALSLIGSKVKVEESESAAATSQSSADAAATPSKEEATEALLGLSDTKPEEKEPKPEDKKPKPEEKKSKPEEKKSEGEGLTPALSKKAQKEAMKGLDKLPPANQGRWSDEEKERLRVALTKENDMDGVQRFVATRRMAAIRSYAPRTFPELYDEMRERMHSPDAKEKQPKQRRRSSRVESGEGKKPDPDEVIEGEEAGPATRRRSRRSSRKPETEELVAKIKQEEEAEDDNDDDGDDDDNSHGVKEEPKSDNETTEDEEDNDDSSHSDDKNRSNKLSLLKRSRKQTMRQAASGNRRRSTQDLSGGRKRRNSSLTSRSAATNSDSDTVEEDSGSVVFRNKRAKTEEEDGE